ncbi:protein kinase domain-containing protein [Streptomyces aidingensis]|nr:serine/threonine-protein kinase [Streptomyces aidingensis]
MQPGEVLDGRYEMTAALGEGGFGEVWQAVDTRIRRRVAVKLLKAGAESAEKAMRRFFQEATTAGNLSHPHIVTVHDISHTAHGDQRLVYLVMELLDGESLAAVVRRGTPAPADALLWARQIADALAAAHARGIIHRDVKPENVIVLRAGGVKVVDFGIAKDPDAGDGLTTTGVIIGSPHYMAPERFTGQPLDARSDLYSLGCLLSELLTGERAFTGRTFPELIYQHTQQPPVAPGTRRPGLPPALDALVLALLAKDPADRPATAAEVRDRLTALAAPGPGPGYTPTTKDSPAAPAPAQAPALKDAGLGELNRVLAADPDNPEALFHRAGRLLDQGEVSEALADLDRAVTLLPDNGHLHLQRAFVLDHLAHDAEIFISTSHQRQALDAYETAVRLLPDSVEAHYGRGRVLDRTNRRDEAFEEYTWVLERQPDHREALLHSADILREHHNSPDRALRGYQRLLSLEPGHVQALIGLADCLHRTGRSAEALNEIDRAIRLDPRQIAAFHVRSDICTALGRLEEAVEDMRRAGEILSGD